MPKQFVKLGANAYFERMTKRLGVLAIVLVCIIAGLFLAADIPLAPNIDAGVPRDNIVADAIALRTTAQGVEVDVSDIVKKYIAVGDSREAVMRHLKALGFEMFFNPQQMDGKDVLIATRYPMERRFGYYYPLPVFTDALRIWVHFDGQAVASTVGKIIYRAS